MDDAALARRFGAIEAQLALISEHLGLECPPFPGATGPTDGGVPAEVLELARGGKEMQAISRLRQLTGLSLVEAKRVVDGL